MKNYLKRFWAWFKASNHWKHFIFAIPAAFFFTLLYALGLATGMELKDHMWGGKFDWVDWACTVVGGIIGQVLQIWFLLWWFG